MSHHDDAGTPESSRVPPASTPLPLVVRCLLLAFAVLCLCLGGVGVFVPGMPTTVFILMAAWAALRSSPRLYGWLMANRLFGPMLHDWHNGGTVRRRAKWNASIAMGVCSVLVAWTAHPRWLAGVAIGCMVCVACWLWRRPEPSR